MDRIATQATERTVSACGAELDRVEHFCYLGRVLECYNSDWPALWKNLQKAKHKWALISRPLIKTGVSPRIVGMFYKAIVQAIFLLYGSETWVVTPPMLQVLDSPLRSAL